MSCGERTDFFQAKVMEEPLYAWYNCLDNKCLDTEEQQATRPTRVLGEEQKCRCKEGCKEEYQCRSDCTRVSATSLIYSHC